MFRRLLLDGLKTGIALAATTTAALMLFGRRERGTPWAALNGLARLVDPSLARIPGGFSPRESSLGLALNAGAMMTAGMLYESVFLVIRPRSPLLAAGAATALVLAFDRAIMPEGWSPIEQALGFGGVIGTYAMAGATLAVVTSLRAPRQLPAGEHDETREDAWFV